jgi:hypothetical protein
MCDHLNPASARLVCLASMAGLAAKARRKAGHRGPLRSIAARYRGYRRCMEWGSRPC